MLSMLVSVAITSSPINLNDLTPESVEIIAQKVITQLSDSTHIPPPLKVTERPEPTPLGALRFKDGRCELIINRTPIAWSQWSRFLNLQNQTNWPNIIRASVAHEVAHCMPEHSTHVTNLGLNEATLKALARTGNNNVDIVKQELFADTVAILYAHEFLDTESAQIVTNSILTARINFAFQDPAHNTSRELKKIIQQKARRLPNETFGQAALRLLQPSPDLSLPLYDN